jgi:hypothetical protein
MKKYRVSYYCTGSNKRSRKYFDTLGEALRFTVFGLQRPDDFFGLDLIE